MVRVKEPEKYSANSIEPIDQKRVERTKAYWAKRKAEGYQNETEKRMAAMRQRKALLEEGAANLEILKRYEENKILYYEPCCRVHGPEKCPAYPCPDSYHTKFHASKSKRRVVFGGNRSGKSVMGVTELIMNTCLDKHPWTQIPNKFPSRNRVFCSDFAVIEKHILPLLKEWIPKNSLFGGKNAPNKDAAWENAYDPRYHLLHLVKGSTIDFMSYDQDTSKAESVELDNVWADEEIPERLYSATLARLVSRRGRFWMTVTPLYSLTWAMGLAEGEDEGCEAFTLSIFDNPHLSKESVQEFINSIPEHEKEARINGRFLELQGLVYKELRKDVHLMDESSPDDNPVIMVMDPHPRKATCITWAYVTPQDDVVFFDELEIGGTAHEIALAIREKESEQGQTPVWRIIDPAAKAQGSNLAFQTDTLKEFEKEGFSFTLADNSEAGYNIVHEYLQWDTSRPLSSTNRPRSFFSRSCLKTWYGMSHLLWDEYKFGRDLKDPKERVKDWKKDFPDCVRYTLAFKPTYRALKTPPRPVAIGNAGVLSKQYVKRDVRDFVFGRRAVL